MEIIFVGIMIEISPQIVRHQTTDPGSPKIVKQNKARHVIFKLRKIKDKKSLERIKRKIHLTCRGAKNYIWLLKNFASKNRVEWNL